MSTQVPGSPNLAAAIDGLFRNLVIVGSLSAPGSMSVDARVNGIAGAVGDGVTDDIAAILRTLNAAIAGQVVTFTPGKTYGISSTIVVPVGVTLMLMGSTIKALAVMTDLIKATDVSNVLVLGNLTGTLDCNLLAKNGVTFYANVVSPANLVVDGCIIKNTATEGTNTLTFAALATLALNGSLSPNRPQRVMFSRNQLLNCGTIGLHFVYTDYCLSVGNFVDGLPEEGIMHVGCQYILCTGNYLRNIILDGIEVGGASNYYEISNNILVDVSQQTDAAISAESCSNQGSITGNIATECRSSAGIIVAFTSAGTAPNDTVRNVIVAHNTVRAKAGVTTLFGISVNGSTGALANGVKISDNTIDGFNKPITLSYASWSHIRGNIITNVVGAASYAIQCVFCTFTTVEDNSCDSVTGDHAFQAITQVGVPANFPDNITFRRNMVATSGAAASKALCYFEGTGLVIVRDNLTGGSSSFIKCLNAAKLQLGDNAGPALNGLYEGAPVLQQRVAASPIVVQAYAPAMTIDAGAGDSFSITVTNAVAFTVNAPVRPTSGQRLLIRIRNTSGGATGALTWNAVFKVSSSTTPATANHRDWLFEYDGTNWQEIARSQADIPN